MTSITDVVQAKHGEADRRVLAVADSPAADVTNVEFLRGQIEAIPLPNVSVDVNISNGVITLSADTRRTLADTFRVLKSGGRLAVSDVEIEPARSSRSEDARQLLTERGIPVETNLAAIDGKFMAAFVRATQPFAP